MNLFTTLAELWNYDSRNFFSNKIRIIFRAVLWPLLKRNDYRNAPSESISPQYEGTRPCLLSSVCPSFLIVRLNSSRALGCCFQKVLFVFVPGARQRKLLFCIWEKINRRYSFACQESPDSTTTIIMDLHFSTLWEEIY